MASFERAALLAIDGCVAGLIPASSPEDAFLAWVLWLPAGADMAECAQREIARIDRSDIADARSLRLRELLVEAAEPASRPC